MANQFDNQALIVIILNYVEMLIYQNNLLV